MHHDWVVDTLGIDPRDYASPGNVDASNPGSVPGRVGEAVGAPDTRQQREGHPAPNHESRYVKAMKIAAAKLGGAAGSKLLELTSPANVAIMSGFTAVYVAAQSTPAGWVADGVALAGLLVGAVFLGNEISGVIDDIRAFQSICGNPNGDLDQAGERLAHAFATVSVDTLLLFLTHKASSGAQPYGKPPEGFVDAVTSDGRIIRLPQKVAEDPAVQTHGSGEKGASSNAGTAAEETLAGKNDAGLKPPPPEQELYPPASSTERPPTQGQLKRMVALDKVHYSQGGVSESLKDGTAIADVAANMRAKGWDRTKPNPDMVQMDDGSITTVDHRRLVAATQAGLKDVPATVHAANQPLPPAEAGRFRLRASFTDPDTGVVYPRGAQPTTWGEAVRFRAAGQRNLGYPSFPLEGSPDLPVIEHHGGAG